MQDIVRASHSFTSQALPPAQSSSSSGSTERLESLQQSLFEAVSKQDVAMQVLAELFEKAFPDDSQSVPNGALAMDTTLSGFLGSKGTARDLHAYNLANRTLEITSKNIRRIQDQLLEIEGSSQPGTDSRRPSFPGSRESKEQGDQMAEQTLSEDDENSLQAANDILATIMRSHVGSDADNSGGCEISVGVAELRGMISDKEESDRFDDALRTMEELQDKEQNRRNSTGSRQVQQLLRSSEENTARADLHTMASLGEGFYTPPVSLRIDPGSLSATTLVVDSL